MCSSANGRFTQKSSAFAPVSSKVGSQTLLHSHMMAHYDKIRNAKSVVDNKPPVAMTSHIKAKDRRRREARQKNKSHSRPGSRATDMDMLNETMIALQSGRWTDADHFSMSDNDSQHQYDYYNNNSRLMSTRNHDDEQQSFNEDNYELESPRKSNNRIDSSHVYTTPKQHLSPKHMQNFERVHRRLNGLSLDEDENATSGLFYSYRSAPTEGNAAGRNRLTLDNSNDPDFKRLRKQEEIRKEEQKYLQFVEDITNDVIVRNISSDRVLRRVFDFHIQKNKDKLDQNKMWKIISELKEDLHIKDGSSTDEDIP